MNRALSFKRRLNAVGIIVIGVLLLAFYAGLRSQDQTETMNQWVSHTEEVLNLVLRTRLQRSRIQNEVWNYHATRKAGLPELFEKDAALLKEELRQLQELTKDNSEQQKILSELGPLINNQVNFLDKAMQQAVTQSPVRAKGAIDLSLPTTTSDNLRPMFDALYENERKLLHSRTESAQTNLRRTRTVLLASGLLAFFIILATGYLIQREISTRVEVEAGLRRARTLLGGRYEEKREELGHAMEDLHAEILARQKAESEIHRLNNELEERVVLRTAELHEANKELEAFTYSVSHDLRAPLRHMEGFSRILQQDCSEQFSEEARHYLKRIRDAAIHMSALVEDLLHLSKIGRQVPNRRSISLRDLAEEARTEVLDPADGRDILWKFDRLPEVEVDALLIRQVFVNFYSNSIKFTRGKPQAIIETRALVKDGEWEISIRDNGAGFDPQFADKLFGVFQRLHRQDEFEGTGIGLASIQRIIHKHGGRVWAESAPGKGATFFFTIPTAPKSAEAPSEMIGAET